MQDSHLIISMLKDIKGLLSEDVKEKEGYINMAKATRYTGLSVSTIRRAVDSNRLKCFRSKGLDTSRGKLLFKKSHLTNWLTSQGGE